ncbi:sterile alpha and TIR motif-containing 1, partial [Paramuricea clavata]
MVKSKEHVQSWLIKIGFEDYCQCFKDNMIDGHALIGLTERALQLLVPPIGPRMNFLQKLDELKKLNCQPQTHKPLEATTPPATLIIEDDVNNPDNQCTSTAMQEQPRSPTATPESEGSRRNSGYCNAGFAIAPEAESRKGLSERLCAIYP